MSFSSVKKEINHCSLQCNRDVMPRSGRSPGQREGCPAPVRGSLVGSGRRRDLN